MPALQGKVAIVTGAGRGIGRAEAIALASEGAAVIVNDCGGMVDGKPAPESFASLVVEEIRAAGGRAEANFADVADWHAAEDMIKQAIASFGSIDILLCNAGIVRDSMIHNIREEQWDEVIRNHLKGHFAPTRHAVAHWRELAKKTERPVNGRIIYTTSEAGLYGNPGQPNYSAAKAGIIGLCFEVAKEVARYGVTVNTIAPRARTPMTEGAFGAFKIDPGGFDAWAPEHIAAWASFLAREEAAGISGQIFTVFGGTIRRMSAWQVDGEIDAPHGWTSAELVKEARKLFPEMQASPPALPDFGLPVK